MERHVHLKINMRCMLLLGILSFDFRNAIANAFYRVYSLFTRFYLIGFVLAQYVEVYQILGRDLFETISNLGVSLLYSITILKMYACRGAEITKLVSQIKLGENHIAKYQDPKLKAIYFRHVELNYFVDKLLIWVGVFTVLPFYVNPILLQLTSEADFAGNSTTREYEEKSLPFSSWFPFDRYRFYYVSYAYHVIAGMIGGSITVSTDIFFVGLMIYAIGQIKMLQHCFRNSKSLAMGLTRANPDLSLESAVKLTIGYCVGMHKIIIEYVDNLNKAMRLLMLFDFAIASMQMAMLGMQMIVAGVGWQQLFAFEFLVAMFIQLFLFYWHANEILLESLAVTSSIWESEWFDYEADVKKSLLIVMARCRRPLVLFVGPFYEMSTQTALAILRAAYSYVAVIRQIYGRKL